MTKTLTKTYVGIGGWTFEPWRGVFYPKGLPHARELSYAGERLTSIEVNGTPEVLRQFGAGYSASGINRGKLVCLVVIPQLGTVSYTQAALFSLIAVGAR